jgi:hypothetical protein
MLKYIMETPTGNIVLSIRKIKITSHDLPEIIRYRARTGKLETGGDTEKVAYYNLLKLLLNSSLADQKSP